MTKLFFIHIPKCAGSTIDYLFRFHFGIRAMNVRNDPDGARISGANLQFAELLHPFFKVASGHGLFLSEQVKARHPNSFWFTILREPRDRYLSHYRYLQQKKALPESLEEWVERGAMRNLQVRWLAGEENLEKAIDVIENQLDFTGRLDCLVDSLGEVAARSGFNLALPVNYRANTTVRVAGEPDEKTLRLIDEANRLDIAMWDHFVSSVWPRQMAKVSGLGSPRTNLDTRMRFNMLVNNAWRGLAYAPALALRNWANPN